MRIKRVEIIGFKSFCDRAVINIDDPITSVVGPNGCGKSNVVDAIRWCMGEQSAKHLRGKAMEDVIFAGSESRGAAAMAEVSLTFDDVGFSHQTLELALTQEESLDVDGGDEPAEPVDEPEGEQASQEAALAADGEGTPQAADGEGTPQAADGDKAPQTADGDKAPQTADGDKAPQTADGDQAPQAGSEQAGADSGADDEGRSASEDVEEFLADKPAAIDFSKFTEVTVTRRLFRDGTSLYMINKTPCRLRDVTDFFMGTGVGTKAYAIIEQGRIGMIVSARPQDRRALIEEAAGITKFKTKKKAAERKLEKTRHNLLRVSDIVSELAKRMGLLRRQAQKAERYRRYKNELRDIELWKASHKYLAMDVQEKVLAATLENLMSDLDNARTDHDARDASVVAERADLSLEERRLAGIQEEIYELENRIKLSESKVEYQAREATELDERVAAAHGEIRSLQTRREEDAARLAEQRRELEALEREIDSQERDMSDREAAVAEGRQLLAEAQQRLDDARSELARAKADLARAESQADSLARRRGDSVKRLEQVLADADEARRQISELEQQVLLFGGKLSELRQSHDEIADRTKSYERRQTQLEEDAQHCEAEVETLRTELHRRKSRLQSLVEIQEKYEGFARGTRAVMQHSSALEEEGADQTIRGIVADVVQAPEKLERAVEAALGDRLGGILVNEPEVGLKAIEYLKETSAGRSSFVPYKGNGAQPGMQASGAGGFGGIEFEDRTAQPTPVMGDGVLGDMLELVTFDEGFAEVGRSLLGECVVVDNLTTALELHHGGAERTLVTLEGDIVDRHGVVSGGSRESQGASVLAQKREIRELEEITAELEEDLGAAAGRFVAVKTELGHVGRSLEKLRTESHDGEIAIMGNEKDLGQCRAELEKLRTRVAQLDEERSELEERLHEVAAEEEARLQLGASAEDRIERFSVEETEMIDRVAAGQTQVEELVSAVTELKVRVAQLGEKRASLTANALQLEMADRELRERIEKLEGSIDDGVARAAKLREECAELEEQLVALRGQHKEKAETLDDGRAKYEGRLAALQEAEVSVRELRKATQELAEQVSALQMERKELGMNRQMLLDGIEERYRIRLRRHVGDYHLRPQIGEEEEKRLEQLKRLIERMGANINLTAIEEFAEVSERHAFLSSQQQDLDNAVGQLDRAIQKINRTSRKLFRDTFEAIDNKFREVFPRLFRGGRASLTLLATPGQDILEAGVEVMAQPPGKKNTTVDQLSGGEKALTAVALIFSIFLIKPSPFCILDEVDAPLDDANVDRYNEIIRNMTDRSQFIIITHNKRSMEIADRLYGVTMQEPGVSKLVSVNLGKLKNGQAAAA